MSFSPRNIVVHHSATSEAASVENIRDAHLDRGYDDIGYHRLIDSSGRSFGGRSLSIEGAHALSFNKESFGICCIGNYEQYQPSNLMLKALARELAVLCYSYKIDPEQILGHKELSGPDGELRTQCPGHYLASAMDQVKAVVSQRLQDYNSRPYEREFLIGNIEPGTDQFSISGRCFNTGTELWDNQQYTGDQSFRLGIKLYQDSSMIWEGRAEFSGKRIAQGQSFNFSIDLAAEYMAKAEIVEIEMLKEGEFWFSDRGTQPLRINLADLALQLKRLKQKGPGVSFAVQQFQLLKSGILELYWSAKNIGETNWQTNNQDCIRLELKNSEDQLVYFDELELGTERIEPGQFATYIKRIKTSGFPCDRYKLQLGLATKGSSFSATDNQSGSISFALPFLSPYGSQPILGAEISCKQVPTPYDFIHRFEGRVTNTGSLGWSNSDVGYQIPIVGTIEHFKPKSWEDLGVARAPYRLGAELVEDGEDGIRVWEGRYALPDQIIESGDSFNFDLELSSIGLKAGKYDLKVGMLKEGQYWFSDQYIPAKILDVEIQETPFIAKPPGNAYNHKLPTRLDQVEVLIVAPTLPLYDREAGGKRLLKLLEVLAENNVKTTFCYESDGTLNDKEKYIEKVEALGITVVNGVLRHVTQQDCTSVTTCILCWYECAAKHIDTIRKALPGSSIVVDSVDIHWSRQKRGIDQGLLKLSPQQYLREKNLELETYRKADQLWVVTEEDKNEVLSEDPALLATRVPYLENQSNPARELGQKKGVLFVGGFSHPPNESAALWGAEICNQARQAGQDLIYYIVGADPPESIRSLHDGVRTIVLGKVDDLEQYYACSKVMLAPIKYGAGVKGKVCDAINAGVPVITTPPGNEGLGLTHNQEILIGETTEELSVLLQHSLVNKYDLAEMTSNAQQKLKSINGVASNWPVIQASLAYKPIIISVVTYNRRELLEKCLRSILSKTAYPSYKIVVSSNGCSDGTVEMMENFIEKHPELIELKRYDSNQYFVTPNNAVIEEYPDSDILLLNNDVEVISKNWLLELYRAAYSSVFVGAAGGLILDGQGLISEAGSEILPNGYGSNFGRGSRKDQREFQLPRYVGYVSGCLMYMKRSSIELIGGLDQDFHPMYYEDAAWQYKLHLKGLKTIYTPTCVATHHEGSTAGTDTNTGLKRYQESNRKKFLDKFGKYNLRLIAQ